ncbi:MAG: hypothetical protein IJL87_02530 [Clostridia bacterium]|nr:hypothetical protein [Clostridia bacterium]
MKTVLNSILVICSALVLIFVFISFFNEDYGTLKTAAFFFIVGAAVEFIAALIGKSEK